MDIVVDKYTEINLFYPILYRSLCMCLSLSLLQDFSPNFLRLYIKYFLLFFLDSFVSLFTKIIPLGKKGDSLNSEFVLLHKSILYIHI